VTDVNLAARVENEYFRYLATRLDLWRRLGDAKPARGDVVPDDDGAVDLRAGDGHARRSQPHVGVRQRRLVEHADECDRDAHPLRAHAEEPDEAKQGHRKAAREPEPRNCRQSPITVLNH